MDQFTYVPVAINYGISIACLMRHDSGKVTQLFKSTYWVKEVLIILNGYAEHVEITWQKNKIPRCAAVNGMQFPSKPAFFDLNELECRLLAPGLVFEKTDASP